MIEVSCLLVLPDYLYVGMLLSLPLLFIPEVKWLSVLPMVVISRYLFKIHHDLAVILIRFTDTSYYLSTLFRFGFIVKLLKVKMVSVKAQAGFAILSAHTSMISLKACP